jgi:hypothetical protein
MRYATTRRRSAPGSGATCQSLEGADPERCEGRIRRPGEHPHEVRLRLISTRRWVQMGKWVDSTSTMTQRANCWSTVCLLDHVQKPLAAPELAARAWAAAKREDDATSAREVSGRASSE